MFSKKLIALVIFVMLMPLLAACGAENTPTPSAPAEQPTTAPTAPAAEATNTEAAPAEATQAPSTGGGGTFKWRAFTEPPTFDPALMEDFIAIDLGQNLYESVTQFNPETLKIEPALAEKWDISPDASVYTFHLRQGVTFSNGDPVTADDIKYSWNRTLTTKGAPYTFVMADIKGATDVIASASSTDTTKTKVTEASGIEVVDPQTIKVTLNGPSAYFLYETALWTYGVINKKIVSKCAADKPSCFNETGANMGAGTGAYTLDTWNHNQNIKFTVNPKYWGPKATVDVEVPIVQDTTTAQAHFENGQLDAIDGPDPKDLKRIQDDPKLKDMLKSVGQARTVWIGFNVNKAPFGPIGDKKADALRQAINMGMDRQQIIDLALSGAGQPVTTLLPKGVPGYQDFAAYKFDPEAAKAKLAEAGYPNCQGLDLTYMTREREVEKAVGTQIQAQFKDNLGCNIKVQGVTWADFLDAREAHQYDMFYGSWGQDYPDPQDWLFALFDSSQIEGEPGATGNGNTEYYKNPEFDKLFAQMKFLDDGQKNPISVNNGFFDRCTPGVDTGCAGGGKPGTSSCPGGAAELAGTGYGTNAQFIYPFRLVKPAQ